MTMNYLHYALIDKYQIQGDPVHMVRTFTFTSIAYRNLYARPGLIHTITLSLSETLALNFLIPKCNANNNTHISTQYILNVGLKLQIGIQWRRLERFMMLVGKDYHYFIYSD